MNRIARWWMLGFALFAGPVAAQNLPPLGGPGGAPFEARCGPGRSLVGVEIRTGDDVDAIRPVCGRRSPPNQMLDIAAEGPFRGGGSNPVRSVLCPSALPRVRGLYAYIEGDKTVIVNSIHLSCESAYGTSTGRTAVDAAFDGPRIRPRGGIFAHFTRAGEGRQECPAGTQAVGVHGRSGVWLDAVGLMCAGTPIRTIGKRRIESACLTAKNAQSTADPARFAQLTQACLATIVDNGQADPAICVRAKRAVGKPTFNGLFTRCLESVPG